MNHSSKPNGGIMTDKILTHCFFDIETLATRPGALILSLAIVPFEFEKPKSFLEYVESGFHIKFNPLEQNRMKRIVDPETVRWWRSQGDAAKKVLLPSSSDVGVEDGFKMIKNFLKSTDYNFKESYLWSRGCAFDFPIIESLYELMNEPVPYNGWKIRDARTFIDIFAGVSRGNYELKDGVPKEFIKHNALHDAALDACKLVELYQNA
jgi:hypothetical protein